MTTLRNTIDELAAQFAANILAALRGASLDDISNITHMNGAPRRGRGRPPASASASATSSGPSRVRRGKGGRLMRRSMDEIGKMVDQIADLVAKHPDGLRAEQIRDLLGCDKKELPRPLADALASGRVTKQGQKRATTYFAGSGGGARRRGRPAKKK
jgi:hypothetical protein